MSRQCARICGPRAGKGREVAGWNGLRMAAEVDGDFVVFLIGMRINKPWKAWAWLLVLLAMPRMLRELARHPELGCLWTEIGFGTIVQLLALLRGSGRIRP